MGLSDETLRLLALLDGDEPTAILDNAEEIAAELRWLASKWGAVDRENTALGTAYADVREAADALRRALSETMVRTVHYDWNADPDSITRLQGDAIALLERCTRSRDVLTSQQREAALLARAQQAEAERDALRPLADAVGRLEGRRDIAAFAQRDVDASERWAVSTLAFGASDWHGGRYATLAAALVALAGEVGG